MFSSKYTPKQSPRRCISSLYIYFIKVISTQGVVLGNYPLGMEDGRIEDQDITATDHHTESSAAHYSRLNSNKGAGAWCHSSVDRDDSEQYLQVGVLHFIQGQK